MFESAANIVEASENRISQLRDSIAMQTAEVETLQSIIAAAKKDIFGVFEASTNGHAEKRKRGRPKKVVESKSVQRRLAIQNEVPAKRRMGIASDVVSYLAGKDDGVTVDVIADSVNCTKQQVSQVLTHGKKKGRFKSVSRGVWALA